MVLVPAPFERALGGERHHSDPLLLAQGAPGLVDAVPVTSPPVAAGGGPRSGGGSPQQAERTRAEETLQVSMGGNAGSSIPFPAVPAVSRAHRWGHGRVALPEYSRVPFPFLQAPVSKAKRGRRASVARKGTRGLAALQGWAVSKVKRWVREGIPGAQGCHQYVCV